MSEYKKENHFVIVQNFYKRLIIVQKFLIEVISYNYVLIEFLTLGT